MREGKQHRQQIVIEKHRVDVQRPVRVAQNRHRYRRNASAVDEAPDDVSTFVAKKKVGQDLQLKIGFDMPRPLESGLCAMRIDHAAYNAPNITLDVFPRARQSEIDDDLSQNTLKPFAGGVIASIRRR